MSDKGKPDFNVYTLDGEGKNAFWLKVGAAWRHEDGKGFNLKLQALPLDGRLVLREPKADDKSGEEPAEQKAA
jgi:hypothetical protein